MLAGSDAYPPPTPPPPPPPHSHATFPPNVLLLVAYPQVKNDVTAEKPQHIIMMKTTTPCNRRKIPLSIPVPSFHYILFRLTISRHVANFGNNVKTKHETDSVLAPKVAYSCNFLKSLQPPPPPPPPPARIRRLGKEWSMNNLPETERSCRISQHTRELISAAPNTDVTHV